MRYLRATTPSAPAALTTHLKIIQDDITFISLASELKGDLNVRRLASGLEGRVAFDFAHVTKVEPEAVGKLEQVLATAAQGAKEVVLCRLPPPALNRPGALHPAAHREDRHVVAAVRVPQLRP